MPADWVRPPVWRKHRQNTRRQRPEVDVRRMEEVTDLSAYDAVVAGSAIRGKQWLPEATQFVQQHQAALRQKPFAAFLVCMTLGHEERGKLSPARSDILDPCGCGRL